MDDKSASSYAFDRHDDRIILPVLGASLSLLPRIRERLDAVERHTHDDSRRLTGGMGGRQELPRQGQRLFWLLEEFPQTNRKYQAISCSPQNSATIAPSERNGPKGMC